MEINDGDRLIYSEILHRYGHKKMLWAFAWKAAVSGGASNAFYIASKFVEQIIQPEDKPDEV